ncbi:MAG: transketolase C-terminal domain-containing protein [Candidatus Bathyarchaeia archaeon]
MREDFGKALLSLGEELEEIVVLDPDVSTSTKTCYFAERFPERFLNVGISEQDMIGMAAGFASSGMLPIATGFAIFVVGRGWEQIRNTVARQKLNVKIAVTHSGLSDYGDGSSHQSVEDVALMRAIPNMTVVVPADGPSAAEALRGSVFMRGPVYLRLGRDGAPVVYVDGVDFNLEAAGILREGSDAAIIANGIMVSMALEAAELLAHEGIDTMVVDMHTVKPLDLDCLERAARETGAIVTAEEHSVIGGLGSAVSEALAEIRPTVVRRIGIRDRFGGSSRTYGELLEAYGLTSGAIAEATRTAVRRRS